MRAKPITDLADGQVAVETGATDAAYRVANIDHTVTTRINECWPDGVTGTCGAGAAPSLRMYRAQVEVE